MRLGTRRRRPAWAAEPTYTGNYNGGKWDHLLPDVNYVEGEFLLRFKPGVDKSSAEQAVLAIGFFTYGLLIMTLTYFQALGRAKLAGFIVVFRQLVLVVPMVLLLPVLMRGNVLGVWLALPLNDIVILFIAVILLMREYRLLRKMQSELVLDTM